jgi:hypothetical protein
MPAMTIEHELLPLNRLLDRGPGYDMQEPGRSLRDAVHGNGGHLQKARDRWNDHGDGPLARTQTRGQGLSRTAPGFAILTYIVNAAHKNNERDAAAVTSGYVKRNGAWKMVLHQQTPLANQQVGQGEDLKDARKRLHAF